MVIQTPSKIAGVGGTLSVLLVASLFLEYSHVTDDSL